MSARVVEAVAIRDDEEGVELRVSALHARADRKIARTEDGAEEDGGVRIEVRVDKQLEDGKRVHAVAHLDLSVDAANELRLGIQRALKASGAVE